MGAACGILRVRQGPGAAFFVCFECGIKWRTKAGAEGDDAPGQPADTTGQPADTQGITPP